MTIISQIPTLEATVNELESKAGNGLCFHRSAALCYDLPDSHIVIGIFQPADVDEPDASKVPFFHCWVEFQGCVLAPTTIERFNGELRPMHRIGYYIINRVSNIRRIPRSRLLQIFKLNPQLLHQLKFGLQPEKDGLLVDKLMKAARLRYQLSETDGVIP